MKLRALSKPGLLALFFLLAFSDLSRAGADEATVRIPLRTYDTLIEEIRAREHEPPRAPATYAIGRSDVHAVIDERGDHPSATVTVLVEFSILEQEWTSVPLFPAGLSIMSAKFGEITAKLNSTPKGIFFNTRDTGNYRLTAKYKADLIRSDGGFTLPVYTPAATAITFTGSLPATAQDVVVLPSAGTEAASVPDEQSIQVKAAVPSGSSFAVSWKSSRNAGYTVGRAEYRGVLDDEQKAISWTARYSVDLPEKPAADLELLHDDVALRDLRIDGRPAVVSVNSGRYIAKVKGAGQHFVEMDFETPVGMDGETPTVQMLIPQVPISKVDLLMPNRKVISAFPVSTVSYTEEKNGVLATLYAPLSDQLVLSWAEARPDTSKEALSASAAFVHVFSAEEGVISGRATLNYEITRGETNALEVELPGGIQVTRVTGATSQIADWRVLPADSGNPPLLQIYFDHQQTAGFGIDIEYDRLLSGEEAAAGFSLPLLRSREVHRQRGLIALLAGKDVAMRTLDESGAARVSESQLPSSLREDTQRSVTHTFKYGDARPELKVALSKPDRKEVKFDASVDTLVSVSDVTMTGSAILDINIKSGSLTELALELPREVNVLSVTAPSLRSHATVQEAGKQLIQAQFTQEMEGELRLELRYETIVAEGGAELETPVLIVRGAEVQQGKIAVEAVTAIDVRPGTIEQLSPCDIADLPRQLVLRTSNPILHAFSYVRSDPPYRLGLKLTRHQALDTQTAAIDSARYQTLFTRDGFAVTTARYMMRNSRKQFLKIALPPGSTIWTASVDNAVEKPALASGNLPSPHLETEILLKIRTSVQPFPVEVIYQTPMRINGNFGRVRGTLPRPDLIVTDTSWDVYLPDDLSYGAPKSNMRLVDGARSAPNLPRPDTVERGSDPQAMVRVSSTGGDEPTGDSLRISVPARGVRYSFQKLYASHGSNEIYVDFPFASASGKLLVNVLVPVAGAALLGGLLLVSRRRWMLGGALITAGAVLAAHMSSSHGTNLPMLILGSSIPAGLALTLIVRERRKRPAGGPPRDEASVVN